MDKRIVCVDIGNTATKFGFFINGKLKKTFRFTNSPNPKLPSIKREDNVIVSSVNKRYEKVMLNKLNTNTICRLGGDIKPKNISMKFLYKDMETLGKDRICFAFYSYQRFKKNILNVSIGSALVIDYIDEFGTFKGGIITAGPTLLLEALKRLDGLKKIKLTNVKNIISGNSTDTCVSLGIINSVIQLVKFYIEKTKCKHIVMSGGNYDIIKPYLPKSINHLYEPDAVILGLYEIYKSVKFD